MARQRSGSSSGSRLILGLIVAVISIISYFGASSFNSITNETQHIDISPQQEIALGLQAAPEMIQQYGGEAADKSGQAKVAAVGSRLVSGSEASKTPYKFTYHLLNLFFRVKIEGVKVNFQTDAGRARPASPDRSR
ncbi:MAG: hypothetical protein EXR62_14685 [Chloroflexi bacterium]|nr:hypothetical protein [Chloroflexota bacterium]